MKKKKLILAAAAITLTLTTACSATLKNTNDIAVKSKKFNIKTNEYFEKIKENNISILVDMIDKEILNKKYKKTEEENKYVEKQINNVKSSYGSTEALLKQVLRSYYGVEKLDDLEDIFRLQYKREQAVKDYVEKHITDKEIEDYYNNNILGDIKVSQIYIKSKAKTTDTEEDKKKAEEEALKTATAVIKKLDEGKSWNDLVKEYSSDEATKTNNGDLGYLKTTDISEKMLETLKELKVKEYSKEPVKSEYGYHIIMKTGQKEKVKLKDIEKDIKDKIKNDKLTNNKTINIDTLIEIRKEAKVEFKDSKLKQAYEKYISNSKENANK